MSSGHKESEQLFFKFGWGRRKEKTLTDFFFTKPKKKNTVDVFFFMAT